MVLILAFLLAQGLRYIPVGCVCLLGEKPTADTCSFLKGAAGHLSFYRLSSKHL